MFRVGMFVRCPVLDAQFPNDPRTFVTGKITSVDSTLEMVTVKFEDPFGYRVYFDFVPAKADYYFTQITQCKLSKHSNVVYRGAICEVITSYKQDEECVYWLQNIATKQYMEAAESKITAPFSAGSSNPVDQLKKYEFQNPCWYLGRQVVQRTMNVLNNSIHGFKELAGSKIYLKAFQLDTIMRCLQSEPCRFMIADEVGLGKTIEASSILKIFLSNHSDQIVLIAVPDSLYTQWNSELLFKFNLYPGKGPNNNRIVLRRFSELNSADLIIEWDFVIVDEVHNYLSNHSDYETVHTLSKKARNVLLLSATPIQQREEEYLNLLRLVLPKKYDTVSLPEFNKLVNKQSKIARAAHLILDQVDTVLNELIPDIQNEGGNIHDNEDIDDEIEDITDNLEDLAELLPDPALEKMIKELSTDKDDLGMYDVQVIVSYVCNNYQLERSIIRSRRAILGVYPEDPEGEFASRILDALPYTADNSVNYYEYSAYQQLINWVIENQSGKNTKFLKEVLKPVLTAFFSSPWAYYEQVSKHKQVFNDEIISAARRWVTDENRSIDNLADILDEPEVHPSRLISIISHIDNHYSDRKIVLFTNHAKTLEKYSHVFADFFGEDSITVYSRQMNAEEAEINVYRFQTDPACKILFCDQSGCEGRNLQIADVIVHIDLPWEINEIEQRIGRLDRLGRDVEKPVISLVPYLRESFEAQLFEFWDKGLNVFRQSLSGLEIIMNEIDAQINNALLRDIEYGLESVIPQLMEKTHKMREIVKREQVFDTAAQQFKPLYRQLAMLLNNYEFNSNDLLSNTMMSWAALAGFSTVRRSKESRLVEFNENVFSVKSAQNTLLIPPNWSEYLAKKQNELVIRVQRGVEEKADKNIVRNNRSLIGTFDRDTAIKNDYIHFFAPGDEVFDCIVDNAMQSFKGKATAFAAQSSINWRGFVYTYSIEPNEKILLENGVSLLALSMFRNYLSTSIQLIPIPLGDYETDSKTLLREYERIVKGGYFAGQHGIEHFGRRGKGSGFLGLPKKYNTSNLEWFKYTHPEEKWIKLVEDSSQKAKKIARRNFEKESKLKDAYEMVNSLLSAAEASEKYYENRDNAQIKELKNNYDLILKSIKAPKIQLESACYIWLMNNE